MSGIYIPGVKMPESCGECPAYWEQCGVEKDAVEEGYRVDRERHPDCPLVHVPDHGRILKVLKTERECVSRDCDRKCGECDLALERNEILGAYDAIISMLSDPAEKEGEG